MRTRLTTLWFSTAAIAAAAILTATRANAARADEPIELGTIKTALCQLVGCSDGERKCAELKGEIKDPAGKLGTLSVTLYCYEGEKQVRGGGASYDAEI